MKYLLLALVFALLLLPSPSQGEAFLYKTRAKWSERKDSFKRALDKQKRRHFVRQLVRKAEWFLKRLPKTERAMIQAYEKMKPTERDETLARLVARLKSELADFNLAKCRRGQPRFTDGFPIRISCVEEEQAFPELPYFLRVLRLRADERAVYLIGMLEAPKNASFSLTVALGEINDEVRQLDQAVDEHLDATADDEAW